MRLLPFGLVCGLMGAHAICAEVTPPPTKVRQALKLDVFYQKHVDVGLRVCDYPTIQDYVGEAVIDTNTSRALIFQMAGALDQKTNHCDWSIHEDLTNLPRSALLHWMWQAKQGLPKVSVTLRY